MNKKKIASIKNIIIGIILLVISPFLEKGIIKINNDYLFAFACLVLFVIILTGLGFLAKAFSDIITKEK